MNDWLDEDRPTSGRDPRPLFVRVPAAGRRSTLSGHPGSLLLGAASGRSLSGPEPAARPRVADAAAPGGPLVARVLDATRARARQIALGSAAVVLLGAGACGRPAHVCR